MTASPEVGLWNKIMKQCLNLKLKVTKCHSTVLLLSKLRQKNLGTNEIEQFLKYTGNVMIRSRIRRSILQHKISDAKINEKNIRTKYENKLQYLQQRWGHNSLIMGRFKQIMHQECQFTWKQLRSKTNQKISFLANKWQNNKVKVDQWRDVMISDEKLKDAFEPIIAKPLVDDNLQLSESEKSILNYPPKFTTFDKIVKSKIDVAVEVCVDKLRWEDRSREEKGEWTEEAEWEAVKNKMVHDETNATINFSKQRVTDLPYNRRIQVPEPRDEMIEIVLANIKSRSASAAKQYTEDNCDKSGNIIKNQNLEKDELAALASLKNRVNDGEVHIMATDKSGKLACESRDQYIASMEPHVSKDSIISLEDRTKLERQLNGHTLQLGRILKIGENHNHWDRVKSALINKFGHVPVLYGLLKDHKSVAAGQPCPTRPVCGATEAPNAQLCHLLSTVVTGLAMTIDEELKTVCRSTEEMLAEIEKINVKVDKDNLTIFSTDVEAMYPALHIATVAEVAAEEFLDSKLEIDLDWQELSLYLAVIHSRQELVELGLGHVTHTRVSNSNNRPGITTKEILNRGEDTESLFYVPENEPTEQEVRKMFSVALKHLIITAMGEHIYSFNGSLRKQSSGAAIGTTLAGALAVLYMLRWCRDFRRKLDFATSEMENFKLHMLKYYVDDGNIISSQFPLGARLCEDGKIRVIENEVEVDRNIPGDERTAKIFAELGNSISGFIKLTTDFPSKHENGFMPLLDIQVKVERNQVIYKFYSKPMSSQFVILSKSAMSDKIKRNTLVQEAIRRLRNTSRELPWDLKAQILSEFSNKMMISGYSEQFRLEVIQSAVRGFEKQCEKADKGIAPLHRPREFQTEQRWKKKHMTKTAWYRPNNAVCFIPATPGGVLARQIQVIMNEEARRIGMSVRVVETGGKSLKQHLVKTDLTGCIYPNLPKDPCFLCEAGVKGGSHTKSGVHYSGQCLLCEESGIVSKYDGESGRNGYWRCTKFHKKEIIENKESNAFAKHLQLFHPERIGDPSVFKLKVESTFSKPLERQVTEGIAITNSTANNIMNSKSEYHQPAVPRVQTTREVRDHGS